MENKTTKKPFGYWTRETCYEEAKKYKSRGEFAKISSGAYNVARYNGWLDDYVWFERPVNYNKKWTYETCFEEAKKYTCRNEFSKCGGGAYNVARYNGWLDDYVWLENKAFDLYKDDIDSVYVYEFKEQKYAYVGRTIIVRQKRRHQEHIDDIENDAVAKFAHENNIPVPEPIYLAENVTLKEGAELEGYWYEKYKEMGWTMLNRAKTGSTGSLGAGKWTRKTCYQEAKKYSSRTEFQKVCHGAYEVALKNGWLDDYDWLRSKYNPDGFWDYDNTYREAQKYTSRTKFAHGNGKAYQVALNNGWLDDYFWFTNRIMWTKETCYVEANKYTTRKAFEKGSKSAFNTAWKNGWLNDYYWLELGCKPNGYWTYELCSEEAYKYTSKSEFRKNCSGGYCAALKNGWLDEFFPKNK